MKLTGKVFDGLKRTMGGGYEPIPSAKVFISNEEGQITPRRIGTTSNSSGEYSLPITLRSIPTPMGTVPVPDVDGKFITADFGGMKRTLPLTSANVYNFDLGTKQGVQEVQEVTVSASKAPVTTPKQKNKALPWIIAGIIVAIGTGAYFLIKKK